MVLVGGGSFASPTRIFLADFLQIIFKQSSKNWIKSPKKLEKKESRILRALQPRIIFLKKFFNIIFSNFLSAPQTKIPGTTPDSNW